MIPALLLLVAAADKRASADVARKAMAVYSACLVDRGGYRLRGVLEMPVGDPRTRAKLTSLNDADCLDDVRPEGPDGAPSYVLSFQPDLMRGSMYEMFYARDFAKTASAETFDDIATIAYPIAPVSVTNEAYRYRLEMDIGDCVVRRDPAAARRLLASAVVSDAEDKAITALVPVVSACTAAGRTVTLSKSVARAMVAEPLYRLTAAKRKKTNA